MDPHLLASAASAIAVEAISLDAGLDPLLGRIGNARVVLIGEASHGTHEFYSIREQLTRRLIEEKGFRLIAIEADWPDTLRVHRHVTGRSREPDAAAALGDFRRFPAWMWRNTVMTRFIDWLREWNAAQPADKTTGIFGMDLYSLHSSIDSVLEYLGKVDPEAARRARERYACFDQFGGDPQEYGHATARGRAEPCEDEVVAQLTELQQRRADLIRRDGATAGDEFFFAEQNARLITNAERYYRSMFRSRASSWNLRDAHMTDTLAALAGHYDHGEAKLVVWAHNSHLGDARATEMGARGEWNVGQLARERFGGQVFNIGFSTYGGSVTAADDWGGRARRMRVMAGLPGSYEALFHHTRIPAFWLDLRHPGPAREVLRKARLQRAIGVIYRPQTERLSHYFETSLPDQFDAMIHIDHTHALEPLERESIWDEGELAETYPFGV